jgi:hypothetical protein
MVGKMAQDEAGAVERPKRGRPREVENPVRVCVRIPAQDYDAIDKQARVAGVSVPAMIRSELLSALLIRAIDD